MKVLKRYILENSPLDHAPTNAPRATKSQDHCAFVGGTERYLKPITVEVRSFYFLGVFLPLDYRKWTHAGDLCRDAALVGYLDHLVNVLVGFGSLFHKTFLASSTD